MTCQCSVTFKVTILSYAETRCDIKIANCNGYVVSLCV